jgi:D-alanine-D-alanine ligase
MSRPAVLFGGPSPEHDVSILTGLQAARAIGDAHAIYWEKGGDLAFYAVDPVLEGSDFVDGRPPKAQRLKLDIGGAPGGFVAEGGGGFGRRGGGAGRALDVSCVVNCCHGGPGEDGTLQAALDLAGLRYTGPSVASAALGMDKLAFAAAVTAAGLPHLPCVTPTATTKAPFDGPYIVKPRFGGSSIGIEVFASWDDVVAYVASPQPTLRNGGAVVEPYAKGADDVEVAIRRHPELQLSELSRPVKADDAIYDYRDKYVPGEGMAAAQRELPAQLPGDLGDVARDAARRMADVAMVRGVARLDFLLVDDQLLVNEINTVPGSLAKHLWEASGVPFAQLLHDMVDEATAGPGRAFPTQGADGSILRSAAAIASKLG